MQTAFPCLFRRIARARYSTYAHEIVNIIPRYCRLRKLLQGKLCRVSRP